MRLQVIASPARAIDSPNGRIIMATIGSVVAHRYVDSIQDARATIAEFLAAHTSVSIHTAPVGRKPRGWDAGLKYELCANNVP